MGKKNAERRAKCWREKCIDDLPVWGASVYLAGPVEDEIQSFESIRKRSLVG